MDYNAIGWFEIPTKDLSRAKKFYETVMEGELEDHTMGSMEMAWFGWDENNKGAAGALVYYKDYKPSIDGTVVYFTVANVEEALEKVEPAGGKILLPKTDIGEHGFIAHIEDTEGNRVALHSMKG